MVEQEGSRPAFGRRAMPSVDAGLAGVPARTPQLSWVKPIGMVDLSFMNAILKIITLGIYQFWGKTEVRKRIWSAIRIDGEPFEYTGTGKELFIGFLFVFGAVLLPLLLSSVIVAFAFGPESPALVVYQLVLYVVFAYLFGVAVYRAQRYRMSRTRWRGIQGSLVGSPWAYAWTSFWTALLIPVTLGWILPWRATRLQKLLVGNMRFGNRGFQFEENSGPLYGRFIVLWVAGLIAFIGFVSAAIAIQFKYGVKTGIRAGQLSEQGAGLLVLVLIGLYFFLMFASTWYRARQFNHFASQTTFESAPFKGTMSGRGLLWLTVSNFLLIVFTLGILTPVAQARAARYFVEHLAFDGPVPLDQVGQSTGAGTTKQGEGLAQAFDFDAF